MPFCRENAEKTRERPWNWHPKSIWAAVSKLYIHIKHQRLTYYIGSQALSGKNVIYNYEMQQPLSILHTTTLVFFWLFVILNDPMWRWRWGRIALRKKDFNLQDVRQIYSLQAAIQKSDDVIFWTDSLSLRNGLHRKLGHITRSTIKKTKASVTCLTQIFLRFGCLCDKPNQNISQASCRE